MAVVGSSPHPCKRDTNYRPYSVRSQGRFHYRHDCEQQISWIPRSLNQAHAKYPDVGFVGNAELDLVRSYWKASFCNASTHLNRSLRLGNTAVRTSPH